jgi:hypothetical protein
MTKSVNESQSNVSSQVNEPLTLTWSNVNVSFNKNKILSKIFNRPEKKKSQPYKVDLDYIDQDEPVEFITKADEPIKQIDNHQTDNNGHVQILKKSIKKKQKQ